MKKFLEDKAYGFYVTCGLAVLSIVTAIVYIAGYKGFFSGGKEVFSWGAFIMLFVWIVPAAGLFVVKQGKYANYLAGLFCLLSFVYFVYYIYYYVSVMITGIDALINAKFVITFVLFLITWIISLANCFFKQVKEPSKEAVKA